MPLVSDAGTPGISDPGALFVRAARLAGIRVDPIPGPSAVTAVLSASGLSFDRFAFAGFPPIRSKDRNIGLSWVARCRGPGCLLRGAARIVRTFLDEVQRIWLNDQLYLRVNSRRPTRNGRLAEARQRRRSCQHRRRASSCVVFVVNPRPTEATEHQAPDDDEIAVSYLVK